jgi:hypothetical protein
MSSAVHTVAEVTIPESAESAARVRHEGEASRLRRPLTIATAGTLLFVATVVLLAQLVSPLSVAAYSSW